jgi:hypothetical protein
MKYIFPWSAAGQSHKLLAALSAQLIGKKLQDLTMKISIFSVLSGLLAQLAASKPAANPQITPAPLARRDLGFAGYYSTVLGSSTVCKSPVLLTCNV